MKLKKKPSTSAWVVSVCPRLLLVLITIALISLASATSDCPSASSFPVTCYCSDSSRTERITTQNKFLEARDDPTSCCYYNPSKVNRAPTVTHNTPNPTTTTTQDYGAMLARASTAKTGLEATTTNTPTAVTKPKLTEEEVNKLISDASRPPPLQVEPVLSPTTLVPIELSTPVTFTITPSTPDYSTYPPFLQELLKLFNF